MEPGLKEFLKAKKLRLLRQIGKGHSSQIFLAEDGKGKKLVIKKERADSTRFNMAEREAKNLKLVNSIGLGPKLLGFGLKNRVILIEFIEGPCFCDWLFSNPGKKQLNGFIKELQKQARALDRLGLDHGQLAGRGKNILVGKRNGNPLPVIIDFEKASGKRKCHNASTIESFLFRSPHGAIAKKVRKILEEK